MTAYSPAATKLLALLDAAARDGHTLLPVAVAGSVLSGLRFRLEQALDEIGPGGASLVSAPVPGFLALRRLADSERTIADAVQQRGAQRLRLVVGPPGAARDAAVADTDTAAVLDDAECLDVETLAAFFRSCTADETAVLAGDLDALQSLGPGRGFADIAAAAPIGVVRVEGGDDSSVLREFERRIRAGQLATVADERREVVVLHAGTTTEGMHRVRQLVSDSIPRALGIEPANIQVLVATAEVDDELRGLCESVGAPPHLSGNDMVGRRTPAVVLLLTPPVSGVISRATIVSAARAAQRHLSVVNCTGVALLDAVATMPHRPRRTLLPRLLGHA